jgi:hypothetical protein
MSSTAGKYKTTAGSMDCTSCPENSASPVGSKSATACVCNSGYLGVNGGPCTACEAGKYQNDQTCTTCSEGKFCPTGSSSAQNCPGGTSSAPGSTSQDDCICNAGYTGSDGAACKACEEGKYKSARGSSACRSCPFVSDLILPYTLAFLFLLSNCA